MHDQNGLKRLLDVLRVTRPRRGSFSWDVSQSLIVNVLITGLHVVSGVLLARLLGPEGRGELAAIQALPLIVGTVGTLGLQDAIIYFGGRDRAHAGRYAVSATALMLVASPLVILIGAALTPIFLRSQTPAIVLASQVYLLILVVNAVNGLSVFTARAIHDIALWNRLRLVLQVLWVVVILAFAFASPPGPIPIAFVYLVCCLLASVLMLGAVRSHLRSHWKPDVSLWRPMLRYGLPAAAGAAPQMMNQRIDQLLIAGMLPAEQLGLYAIGVAWGQLVLMPGVAMDSVAFSKIAGMRDVASQLGFLRKACVGALVVCGGAGLLLIAMAPVAIPAIFGEDFRDSVPVAMVIVGGTVLKALTRMLHVGMKGMGAPSVVLYAEWSGLAILVLSAPFLIGKLATVGAAVAVLAGCAVSLAVSLIFVRRRTARMRAGA